MSEKTNIWAAIGLIVAAKIAFFATKGAAVATAGVKAAAVVGTLHAGEVAIRHLPQEFRTPVKVATAAGRTSAASYNRDQSKPMARYNTCQYYPLEPAAQPQNCMKIHEAPENNIISFANNVSMKL